MNNMSYWTRAVKSGAVDSTDIAKDMQGLVDKGVPKAKLGVGIGLDYEERRAEVDCDPKACAAKCRFAIDKGYGGVMIWAIEKDAKKFAGKHPCHEAISAFTLSAGTASSDKGKKALEVRHEDSQLAPVLTGASEKEMRPMPSRRAAAATPASQRTWTSSRRSRRYIVASSSSSPG